MKPSQVVGYEEEEEKVEQPLDSFFLKPLGVTAMLSVSSRTKMVIF